MACIVRRPGCGLTAQDLTAHAMTTLARFMVPRYIRFVDHMPRTPTDKVEKFRLAQQGITADTWDRERLDLATSAPHPSPHTARGDDPRA